MRTLAKTTGLVGNMMAVAAPTVTVSTRRMRGSVLGQGAPRDGLLIGHLLASVVVGPCDSWALSWLWFAVGTQQRVLEPSGF
jgi:hypothetical protein